MRRSGGRDPFANFPTKVNFSRGTFNGNILHILAGAALI
jgi:hypothetical protein